MIPAPTEADLAIDLEAEYLAADRDGIRRALIRRLWGLENAGEWTGGIVLRNTEVRMENGNAVLSIGTPIIWRK